MCTVDTPHHAHAHTHSISLLLTHSRTHAVFMWYPVPPESLLSPEQVHATVELAKRAKEACQNVSTEHKDIHASISKFGRAIDKVS